MVAADTDYLMKNVCKSCTRLMHISKKTHFLHTFCLHRKKLPI